MSRKARLLIRFIILALMQALICFTPLGAGLRLGKIELDLTLLPVLVAGLTLGSRAGSYMGLLAGVFSFTVWTFAPPIPREAFLYTPFYTWSEIQGNVGSLLICFLPKILAGALCGLLYVKLSKRLQKKDYLCMAIATAVACLTSEISGIFGIWLFFGGEYSGISHTPMYLIARNNVISAVVPVLLICIAVCPLAVKLLQLLKRADEV